MLAASASLTQAASMLAAAELTALWEGGLLVMVTVGCLRLLPNLTAAVRTLVWMAVFVAAAALPCIRLGGGSASAGFAGVHTAVRFPLVWAFVILAAWAAASIYRVVRLAHSAWRVHRLARNARPLHCTAAMAGLLRRRESSRGVDLCASDEVDVPSVVGFLRPRILLPSALCSEMAASDVQYVILHELEHLRRRDDWTNLLQKLVLAVFPINVVLVWMERRVCAERELACDDGVVRLTGRRKAYAACLANLAEHSLRRRGMLLVLGVGQRRSELERRVCRILHTPQGKWRSWSSPASAALILGAVFAVSTFCARVPALVAFGSGEAADPGSATAAASEQMEAVGGTAAAPARMTLVNTVLPRQTQTALGHTSQTCMHRAARRAPTERSLHGLTLDRRSAAGPGLVWAVADEFSSTYAAVPLRDGWLIVQL